MTKTFIALTAMALASAPANSQIATPVIGSGLPAKVKPKVKLPRDAPWYLKTLNSDTCRKLFAYSKTGFSDVPYVSESSIETCNSALKHAKLAQQKQREALGQ